MMFTKTHVIFFSCHPAGIAVIRVIRGRDKICPPSFVCTLTERQFPNLQLPVMLISLIVAMDKNRLIGANNGLPWRLPDDMKWVSSQYSGET